MVEQITNNPKVSVIVPIYKVEKYLMQCIDSIVNQTLRDIEIILVDEGDLDECRAIIDLYDIGAKKDERVIAIHEKNGGYGASVNKGMKIAKGEYIGIVESDDFIEPEMFEELYKMAEQFNKPDIVKSDHYLYKTIGDVDIYCDVIKEHKEKSIQNAINCPSLLRIIPSIWSSIYRKDFILKNNLFFLENHKAFLDTSFFFKTTAVAKSIVFLKKAFYHYRVDNQNSSVKQQTNFNDVCIEYDDITNFLNKNNEMKNLFNSEKLIRQYEVYKWNLKRIDEKCQKEFIEIFSRTFKNYYNNGEIDENFFKYINKKEFINLIENPLKFQQKIAKKCKKYKQKVGKTGNFSIRVNKYGVHIVLFGKKVLSKNFK